MEPQKQGKSAVLLYKKARHLRTCLKPTCKNYQKISLTPYRTNGMID